MKVAEREGRCGYDAKTRRAARDQEQRGVGVAWLIEEGQHRLAGSKTALTGHRMIAHDDIGRRGAAASA